MKKLQKRHRQTNEWLVKATTLKEVVLDRLDSMPEALRNIAPAPSQWSAYEVVEHLILVEENVAGLWRQNLLNSPAPIVTFRSTLASGIVTFIFSKTSMRTPTVPALEPKGVSTVDELREQWDTARARLVAALPDDAHTAWILHPAFGPLSSDQMGGLLTSHLEHHLRHWPTFKT
jgi:hypothetical protein